MSKIFLVRHGQDKDNASGILNGRRDKDLTELGKEQAKTVADKLKDNNIQVVCSSFLKRTFRTAEIIAKELDIDKIIVEEDLIERDFGILTGKPVVDILKYTDKIIKTDKVNYFLKVEGAEDFPTLFQRGRRVLEKVQNKHPDKNVLLVTSGDIGKMIRAAYHNWSWEEGLKAPYFDNTGILELSLEKDVLE